MNQEKIINLPNYKILLVFGFILIIFPYLIRYLHGDPLFTTNIFENLSFIDESFIYENFFYENYIEGNGLKIYNIVNILILPILLMGIFSIYLLYKTLKVFGFDKLWSFIFTTIFVFSPTYLFTFQINKFSIILFSFLLGLYLFARKCKISFLFFLIPMFFGVHHTIIILLALYAISVYKPEFRNTFLTVFFISLFFNALYVYKIFIYDLNYNLSFLNLLSDLGSFNGFGIFSILLAILGIANLWKKNKSHLLFLFALSILIFSIFFPYARVYSNLILIFFATSAVYALWNRKWSLDHIKQLSFLLIFCGLLFSTVSYANLITDSLPNKEVVESIWWIKNNDLNEDSIVILTHSSNLPYLKYYLKNRVIDGEQIYHLNNIEDLRKYIIDNNIHLIFISKNMYEGLVWHNRDNGLIYLLNNRQTFKKEFSNLYIEVWSIISKEET